MPWEWSISIEFLKGYKFIMFNGKVISNGNKKSTHTHTHTYGYTCLPVHVVQVLNTSFPFLVGPKGFIDMQICAGTRAQTHMHTETETECYFYLAVIDPVPVSTKILRVTNVMAEK